MPTHTVRVIARITANLAHVATVRGILTTVVVATRHEPGCLRDDLLHNHADPGDFTIVEEWQSDAAEQHHMSSSHVLTALGELDGLLGAAPDIRRYWVVI